MKRGSIRNPKMLGLAKELRVHQAQAIGHLTALWEFTAEFAKAGDVGRYSNEAIARGSLWDGDADSFVNALVVTRWLDENEKHRLLVHDWAQHCEYSVSKFLFENKLRFADGSKPRAGVKSHASKSVRVATRRNLSQPVAPTVAVAGAVPLPEPLPEPDRIRRAGPRRPGDGSQCASYEKTEEQQSLEKAIYRENLFKVHDDSRNLSFSDAAFEVVREAAGDLFSKRGLRELRGAGLEAMRATAWTLLKPDVERIGKMEPQTRRRGYLIARAVECAAMAGKIEAAGNHSGAQREMRATA